jgi:hypothetical protein
MSATQMPMAAGAAARVLIGLVAAWSLIGCGNGGSYSASEGDPSSGASPPAPKPTSGQSLDGRYVGTVTIGAASFFGDALLTSDGALRLYVGNAGLNSGALPRSKPGGSAQFVGEVRAAATGISGTGRVFGQDCAPPDVVAFCSGTASASASLTLSSEELRGEIEVMTPGGPETWSLDLGAWRNYYDFPAGRGSLAGQFQEVLAEFERDGDVIINIDGAGRLFFQGASSGCTGNGDVSPHLDGQANVYDVTLTIASCDAAYAHLNGAYSGLATTTPSSYWDYDSLLRVWLSTRDADAAPAAITMLAEPL